MEVFRLKKTTFYPLQQHAMLSLKSLGEVTLN